MFHSLRRVSFVIFLTTFAPVIAHACLWDHDTIMMERSRFPSALELITGKFLRHSPEFYEWRVQDRLKRLQSDPNNVALLDDLAVAYDKTGRQKDAIRTALRSDYLYTGRYETEANLGTFYLHAGNMEEGIVHIDRALRINPSAHFGREKVQRWLAEWVSERKQATIGGLSIPRESALHSFTKFVCRKNQTRSLNQQQANDAVRGVLGIMRFGKHDSPIILEALGSLLTEGFERREDDAKHLAARAYLRASYSATDEKAKNLYRIKAIEVSGRFEFDGLEREFQSELAEAEAWYAELRNREISWIKSGLNPEREFDKLYLQEVALSAPPKAVSAPRTLGRFRFAFCVFMAVIACAIAFLYSRAKRVAKAAVGLSEPSHQDRESLSIDPRLTALDFSRKRKRIAQKEMV